MHLFSRRAKYWQYPRVKAYVTRGGRSKYPNEALGDRLVSGITRSRGVFRGYQDVDEVGSANSYRDGRNDTRGGRSIIPSSRNGDAIGGFLRALVSSHSVGRKAVRHVGETNI